jgi:hypothetical protein
LVLQYLGLAEKVVCEEREQGTLNWEQFLEIRYIIK